MATKFDNIEDVNSKFVGTICYHEKMPVLIKAAQPSLEEPGSFVLNATNASGRSKYIKLNDPALNYRDFNIGYANQGHYAVWWYRRPIRQYRQGLKKDQMGFKMSMNDYGIEETFGYSKPYINMLKNHYPDLPQCDAQLRGMVYKTIAFHKDFALSWDEVHSDFILEYRGRKIGCSVGKDLKQYNLLAPAEYLAETLQGVLYDVYG